jgi:hypothetical protein
MENLFTICNGFTFDQQNEHNIKLHQKACQKNKINKNKNSCGLCGEVCGGSNKEISRKTGQINSSCTHYKTYSNGTASKSSGRSTYTNQLISCLYRAWILYGLIIFPLILIIDIMIATNQYLNL